MNTPAGKRTALPAVFETPGTHSTQTPGCFSSWAINKPSRLTSKVRHLALFKKPFPTFLHQLYYAWNFPEVLLQETSQRIYPCSMPCSIYWNHAASCNQIYSSEPLIPSEPVVWQVRHQSCSLPHLSPGLLSTSDLHRTPSQSKQGQRHWCSLQSTPGPTNSTSSTSF